MQVSKYFHLSHIKGRRLYTRTKLFAPGGESKRRGWKIYEELVMGFQAPGVWEAYHLFRKKFL
jgi:hypothetical protein